MMIFGAHRFFRGLHRTFGECHHMLPSNLEDTYTPFASVARLPPPLLTVELLHVAAELIELETSDAQCQPVCLYPRLDRDWIRSMGGLARQCACFPLNSSRH